MPPLYHYFNHKKIPEFRGGKGQIVEAWTGVEPALSGFAGRHLTVWLPGHKERLEVWAGIEPANNGFADHRLTTWLPDPIRMNNIPKNMQ